jgi:DNA-binding NarL/FixJ family response regulator
MSESVRFRWQSLLANLYELRQTSSLSEAEKILQNGRFDLILLHRSLIDLTSAANIRRSAPQSKILLLSDRPDEEEGIAFLRLGVVGYANTYISRNRLREAVRVISQEGVWVGQKIMQRLIRESMGAKKTTDEAAQKIPAGLTRREAEIASLVASGMANNNISEKLGITERTVKAHLTTIYNKTGTKSRLQLALLVNRQSGAPE